MDSSEGELSALYQERQPLMFTVIVGGLLAIYLVVRGATLLVGRDVHVLLGFVVLAGTAGVAGLVGWQQRGEYAVRSRARTDVLIGLGALAGIVGGSLRRLPDDAVLVLLVVGLIFVGWGTGRVARPTVRLTREIAQQESPRA